MRTFTDAELFQMFNVDCGHFIAATNHVVNAGRTDDRKIDPSNLYGVDLWDIRTPRMPKGVIDPSAMDADELHRCRTEERRERVERLTALVAAMDAGKMEEDDISITDLIEKPKYI